MTAGNTLFTGKANQKHAVIAQYGFKLGWLSYPVRKTGKFLRGLQEPMRLLPQGGASSLAANAPFIWLP